MNNLLIACLQDWKLKRDLSNQRFNVAMNIYDIACRLT